MLNVTLFIVLQCLCWMLLFRNAAFRRFYAWIAQRSYVSAALAITLLVGVSGAFWVSLAFWTCPAWLGYFELAVFGLSFVLDLWAIFALIWARRYWLTTTFQQPQ